MGGTFDLWRIYGVSTTVLLRLRLAWKKMCHFLSIIEKLQSNKRPCTNFYIKQCSKNIHIRPQSDFSVLQVNTFYFGQNSIKYLGPSIGNSTQTTFRNVEFFVEFKSLIKNWEPSRYSCRLCKYYILQPDFVNVTQ